MEHGLKLDPEGSVQERDLSVRILVQPSDRLVSHHPE